MSVKIVRVKYESTDWQNIDNMRESNLHSYIYDFLNYPIKYKYTKMLFAWNTDDFMNWRASTLTQNTVNISTGETHSRLKQAWTALLQSATIPSTMMYRTGNVYWPKHTLHKASAHDILSHG